MACARRAAAPRRWPDDLLPAAARRWAKGEVSTLGPWSSGMGPWGRLARTEGMAMLMAPAFFFGRIPSVRMRNAAGVWLHSTRAPLRPGRRTAYSTPYGILYVSAARA